MIKIKNITFAYPSFENKATPVVLKNLSLNIQEGEFLAVLGHNGCGKSTLARMLNGILQPQEGEIIVDGINAKDEEKLLELRQTVGLVFQNPDNQIVATIVEEDVAFALENLGVPTEEMRERVDIALKAVDMYKYRDHAPHRLSGGQKQRVAIAGIIAMRPKYIVLDEPTAMLDPIGRKEVLAVLDNLRKEYGISVVLITHFMEETVNADRIIIMDKGEIVEDDSPQVIFSKVNRLNELGLELPKQIDPLKLKALVRPLQSDNPVLRTEKLTYIYGAKTPFEKTALNDINIDIEKGEILGIIGHTGSGKSSLIQHFNALLKPTFGKVYVENQDINISKDVSYKTRFKVGLVFQYPEYQLFEDTVYKDISFGPKNMGLSSEEIDKRVRETAADVGLSDEVLEQSPFDISGGQKRRTAIAGILAMQPQILVLDEPTAGLDPRGRKQISKLIKKYQADTGATVIIVSHNMEEVINLCSRVIKMENGICSYEI
ncbi:MAG: energy-coupling factor transporter ATPase [Oscillospiraceae bacterium]|jgi:energy-coupling factor transport system ATP-binding protein|nr:energy-coupling factor transporter ATPase [Oscillospiraceae bacterium]